MATVFLQEASVAVLLKAITCVYYVVCKPCFMCAHNEIKTKCVYIYTVGFYFDHKIQQTQYYKGCAARATHIVHLHRVGK